MSQVIYEFRISQTGGNPPSFIALINMGRCDIYLN